jgi:glycosyltransferase involved in cell wall biosynthesis
VNTARGYRGGERQTELLIRGLASRGVRQVLVARRGGALAGRLHDVDIEIRTVAGNVFSVVGATRGVSLLHVHEGRSVYAAYLRSLLSGTPYIVTRRVNNPIREHFLAHRAYRNATYVAAVAPQVGEIVRAYDAAIPVEVIHSGSSGLTVDAARATAIRSQFPGKFIVGHVGALDNGQKGQEFVIAVARELERSAPDVQFMFVGGGSDEALLKSMAAGLKNVAFTGHVDNVGDYLAAFDLFILPSNREGIGSILFDAMEQGLALVASRVGGVPDIVLHGKNGLLVDPASPEQLRAAILELRAAPERRAALGAYGREFAKGFTAEVMWRKYLALYESILGKVCEVPA